MLRTSVMLGDQAVKGMRFYGKQAGLSVSSVLRQALRDWILKEKRIARAFAPTK